MIFLAQNELTTQQAAELLHISRRRLVELLDQKQIPSKTIGIRRRVQLADIEIYRKKHNARRIDLVL
jgi:excisionase family DNA binding protein